MISRTPRLCAPTMLLAAVAALCLPASAGAAVTTFGSQLNVPATLNTSENLNYTGTGIAVPGEIIHIGHDGADTALWNVTVPEGSPTAPVAGQVTKFALEGCAQRPQGAPAPLTQIHFQDLVPLPNGGARVNVTSQPFDIPVCGENGANGSTVTNYAPVNFCVAQGDYVDFNDEGGWVPGENGGLSPYPSGVPYQVIGSVKGAEMDSFIRGGGTNNGATFSTQDTTAHDGFAANRGEELMLQATLATGTDAITSCGGTQLPAGVHKPPPVVLPPLRVSKQTDGINSHKIASVAVYCRPSAGCKGKLTLSGGARGAKPITSSFVLQGGKTSHVAVRVPKALVALARKRRSTGVPMKMTAVVEGQTFTQTVTLRIY